MDNVLIREEKYPSKKIQDEYITWSEIIKSLADMTPPDISFSYVKINALDQTIKIKGHADLRDSLLKFKDSMAAAAYFQNIEFPIKNILEKENINFEIDAKINLANLQSLYERR